MTETTALRSVPAQQEPVALHSSDCAIYNAPALPVGPCDCEGLKPADSSAVGSDSRSSLQIISEECAKIAEDHVGGAGKIDEDATVLADAVASAYDEACRDIAKAIRDTYAHE